MSLTIPEGATIDTLQQLKLETENKILVYKGVKATARVASVALAGLSAWSARKSYNYSSSSSLPTTVLERGSLTMLTIASGVGAFLFYSVATRNEPSEKHPSMDQLTQYLSLINRKIEELNTK